MSLLTTWLASSGLGCMNASRQTLRRATVARCGVGQPLDRPNPLPSPTEQERSTNPAKVWLSSMILPVT